MQPVISARGVKFWFGQGELRKQILFGVDLEVRPGEVLLLGGPSGSGKTTLLTLISALRTLHEGSLMVLGEELRDAPAARQVATRRRIGFVFQAHNLLPHLTALDNVRLLLELSPGVTPEEGRGRAAAILGLVGLGQRLHARPDQLSGGQRQRVAVARALVGDPSLVLADEPTSALDSGSGREVVGLLERLARERGVPVVMVTHDPRVADVADRVLRMEDGRITADEPGPRRRGTLVVS